MNDSDGLRDAVANNRRIMGMPPQPMHETHDSNELGIEAVKLAISGINDVLGSTENMRKAATKLLEAARLMGHAADKREPSKPETP